VGEDLVHGGEVREEIARLVPLSSRRMLDVGCADGVFGAALKSSHAGLQVVGVDAEERYVMTARDRGYDEAVAGTFPLPPDTMERLGKFDCVVFNDVLEHMVRPDEALFETRHLLSGADAVVVCSIPNVRFLPILLALVFKADWRYTKTGVLDFTHLRFFTFKSARRLLEQSGYEIVSCEGVNGILGPRVPGLVRKMVHAGRRFVPKVLFKQIAIVARSVAADEPQWAP
jgi:SAM-dependent methyltransferase